MAFCVGGAGDLASLYASADGLQLEDGTLILPREGVADATSWLKRERSLDDWAEDIIVIGERDDLIIARDVDLRGVRAGGGVVEAAADSLSSFKRAALTAIGYLEGRIRGGRDLDPHPEAAARAGVLVSDEVAIAEAIKRPFYPGRGSSSRGRR